MDEKHTGAPVAECARPHSRDCRFRGQSTECEGERLLTKGLKEFRFWLESNGKAPKGF